MHSKGNGAIKSRLLFSSDSEFLLLMSGVQENAVSLPLEPDTNYTIILQPVDMIGNSETLQTVSPRNFYTFFYPKPEGKNILISLSKVLEMHFISIRHACEYLNMYELNSIQSYSCIHGTPSCFVFNSSM